MEIQAYVFFDGSCEEALSFYADKLGAELMLKMHYKDAPPDANRPADPKNDNMVMHASVKIGSSILMMSDNCMTDTVTHDGFKLSLTANDLAHGEKLFNALADKFGIGWMVTIPDAS
jgi:PhnB protein